MMSDSFCSPPVFRNIPCSDETFVTKLKCKLYEVDDLYPNMVGIIESAALSKTFFLMLLCKVSASLERVKFFVSKTNKRKKSGYTDVLLSIR